MNSHLSPRRLLRKLRHLNTFRIIFILTIMLFTLDGFWTIRTALAACTISGTVYQDYNATGTQDALEPGIAGVVVTAYQTSAPPPGGTPPPPATLAVGTATTLANGSYTFNVAVNGEVRVEFTEIPDYLRSGRFATGNDSTTTTTFVNCAGVVSGIDLAVNTPGDFCNLANPQLGTSCYVLNDQLSGASAVEPTFVTFPYVADGDPTPGVDPETVLALARQTGTTWGLGYHRSSDSFIVGSFLKRHTGFGPSGTNPAVTTTGGIYRITPPAGARPAAVSMFLDLGAFTGADPHPTSLTSCFPGGVQPPGRRHCWQYDSPAYALVGKMSLGDVDISPDDHYVYTINLLTRQLLEIPIVMSAPGTLLPGAPRPYNLTTATLPGLTSVGTACPASDYRPFGLGMHAGRVFVGGVCSAESTQDLLQLRAYVHSIDPLNPALGFRLDLTFPLDYPRRCVDHAPACPPDEDANWRPWISTWPTTNFTVIYPQPWLTDIVFDGNDMVLGFRDRNGDQTGNLTPGPLDPTLPPAVNDTLQLGIAAGDMLRACDNGAGGWTLEDNASCGGGPATAGAGNGQGPDVRVPPAQVGGEYYYQDGNALGGPLHDEILLGGIVDIPGFPEVASTAFDPLPPGYIAGDNGLFDGGVVWYDNDAGNRTQNYRIFNGDMGVGPNVGKSNGLGDLEAVCGPPPLEIGNRVWEDLDRNGVQDPGELPLANVTLRLYMISDAFGRPINQLVGETTTSATGEYYFNESNIPMAGVLGGSPVTAVAYVNYADTNNNNAFDPALEPRGVLPNTVYEIRLDEAANYAAGAILADYYITPNDTLFFSDLNDNLRDSDGVAAASQQFVSATNFPAIRLRTGDYGDNNHTYDFGFARIPPPVRPAPAAAQGGGGLQVTKGVDKPFAMPGDIVTWTITIHNPNGSPVAPVIIEDTFPGTLEILVNRISHTSSTASVTVNGQVLTFNQAVMAAGETVTITVPTRILGNTAVPFIIVNEIPGFGDAARAQVASVAQLPNTGESVWEMWRTPALLLVVVGLLLLTGVIWRRTGTKVPPAE